MYKRQVNEYGKAKLSFYKQAAPLCREYGMTYFHLRFFSVYGPGDHPWSIISTLTRELPKGETVSLSACRHRWNFMYIRDAAEAVYQLHQTARDVFKRQLLRFTFRKMNKIAEIVFFCRLLPYMVSMEKFFCINY